MMLFLSAVINVSAKNIRNGFKKKKKKKKKPPHPSSVQGRIKGGHFGQVPGAPRFRGGADFGGLAVF